MTTLTNNTKFNVQGVNFTCVDLRDNKEHPSSDTTYYGYKEPVIITNDDNPYDASEWDLELNAGDLVWIDGCGFYVVVVGLNFCNGIKFITAETYKSIARNIEDNRTK